MTSISYTVQAVVGAVGIVGNTLVCLVIWRDSAMHNLTNAFIFNQATVDFLASVVMLVSSVVPIPQALPSGTAGILFCKVWIANYFLWAFFVVSSFNLVALTSERYLAIVHPYKFQRVCHRRAVVIVIASVWMAGFVAGIYTTALYHYNDGRCEFYSDTVLQGLGVVVPGLHFVFPAISMLVAYIHIMVELRRSAKRLGLSMSSRANSGQEMAEQESAEASLLRARVNTFKTLVLVFTAYVLSWSLNSSLTIAANLGVPLDNRSVYGLLSVALVCANSAVNPLIYAFKYKRFQAGFKQVFRRRNRAVQPFLVVT